MKNIVFGTLAVMAIVLLLAGCAFDKLRLSIDSGKFTPLGGTNSVPNVSSAIPVVF